MSVPSTVLNSLLVRRSAAFAGYTFLLYDYLLTLSFEVEYIWDAPWTLIKMLFLMVRYWTLIGQTLVMLEETGFLSHHSERFCAAFTLYRPFFVILCGEAIRLMVVMRACAVMRCKRFVAITWNAIYIFFSLSVLGVVLYFFIRIGPPSFEYLTETGICFAPAPPNLWTILFITLVLDSVIVIIICYSLHRMTDATRDVRPSPLVRLLVRDAILFYMATLFNSLLCIVCWTVWSLDPRNTLQEWISIPFLIVMGERLILNLRRFRARPDSTRELSEEMRRQMAALGIDEEQLDTVSAPQTAPHSLGEVGYELGRVGR